MLTTQSHFNLTNSDAELTQLQQFSHPFAAIAPQIKTIAIAEQERIIAGMVLAFSDDPAVRWMYPDSHQYLTYFPQFVRAFGGKAFLQETAYCTEDYAGAALWFPPGVEPDGGLVFDLLQQSIAKATQPAVFAVFEQMEQYHPREHHWYLPLIGVDPMQQGKGCGSALIRHVLEQCDRDGLPAYLEASNPSTVPFYQRHGFEVLGIIRVESSPSIIPMLRQPH